MDGVTGYDAFITDTTTDETRREHFAEEWGDGFEYLWSDGNFGCDCNRAQFFAVAAGGIDLDGPCGDERYMVRIEVDGVVVYDEKRQETGQNGLRTP